MSDLSSFNVDNVIQPITDDFSSDGMLDEYARVDHQHPLSASLRNKIEFGVPFGFHIWRSVNSNPVGSLARYNVDFGTIVLNSGFLPVGWTYGMPPTVPANGGGLYIVNGGEYHAALVAPIYVTIWRNGLGIAACNTPNTATDRNSGFGNVARLIPGDVLNLSVLNNSAGNITITTLAASVNDVQLPFLSAWRIAA